MLAVDSEIRLRERLGNAPINTLRVSEGINSMIDFYQTERAEDCDLESDGDMLLFQWGTYDFGNGELFQIDITRQFITAPECEDDDISQLSLTFFFNPTPYFHDLGPGNEWCGSPEELSLFQMKISNCPAYKASVALEPNTVTLSIGGV